MTLRIGINGFGRIGRTVFRQALTQKDVEIVHINDLSPASMLAHLLRYDSVHGRIKADVDVKNDALVVNGKVISLSAKAPGEIPWKDARVDIVFECTGVFRKREAAMEHVKAGAPKVLISAPAIGEDITVVRGVNCSKLKPEHIIVSNGSCTTNCLAPVAKVIHETFGVVSGLMTTVHSYTNDQRILDVSHSDFRRARAGALNMIPTETGAAKAIGLVLPDLAGKIDGLAVRVPTPNVSIVDVTFQVTKMTTKEEVNQKLREAASGPLKGILGYTDEELVSSDFNGSTESSFVDGDSTKVMNGNLVKVLSWYDNETGFSCRMLDIARLMSAKK